MAKSTVVSMVWSKDTKNAAQYKETDETGRELDVHDAKIGSVYLKKRDYPAGMPKVIKVTVESD